MTFKQQALSIIKKIFQTWRKLLVWLGILIVLIVIAWISWNINWVLLFKGYPDPEPVKPRQARYEFEIPVDSFDRETIHVRSDQFLSEILLERGVSLQTIDKIARDYKYVFDVKNIKSGNRMNFFYTLDSLHKLQFMVYEKSASQYVVYDFRDSLAVMLRQKEIRTEIQYREGEIKTTLWDAVDAWGIPTSLVYEITDVYAWMIDPYALNRGDRLEVIFENQVVDSVSIGVGKVLAARFLWGKRWYEAYSFEQNGSSGYFDEKGESLKRAFLKAPLNFRRISSRFSGSRMHPVLRIRRPHFGVDYAAPTGTEVWSIGDGKVIQKSYDRGSGNMVKIKHNGTYTSGYMHLTSYGKGITLGSSVRQGDVIGYVGSTGLATGPHLDFRIWRNGQPVDPLKVEAPPVEPIEARNKPVFDSIVKRYQKEFERYKTEIKGIGYSF